MVRREWNIDALHWAMFLICLSIDSMCRSSVLFLAAFDSLTLVYTKVFFVLFYDA